MEITIPGSLSGEAVPLAGTRHVDPGPTARARLALAAKQTSGAKAPAPFNATLSVTIAAANHVFVRGRGIDAELSGDLKVAGTSANPQVKGGFDLRRGTLSMLGNQLNFIRGGAQFHGDAMPRTRSARADDGGRRHRLYRRHRPGRQADIHVHFGVRRCRRTRSFRASCSRSRRATSPPSRRCNSPTPSAR